MPTVMADGDGGGFWFRERLRWLVQSGSDLADQSLASCATSLSPAAQRLKWALAS